MCGVRGRLAFGDRYDEIVWTGRCFSGNQAQEVNRRFTDKLRFAQDEEVHCVAFGRFVRYIVRVTGEEPLLDVLGDLDVMQIVPVCPTLALPFLLRRGVRKDVVDLLASVAMGGAFCVRRRAVDVLAALVRSGVWWAAASIDVEEVATALDEGEDVGRSIVRFVSDAAFMLEQHAPTAFLQAWGSTRLMAALENYGTESVQARDRLKRLACYC